MSTPSLSARPALLFDLDGTLVDSVYQHVLSWRKALGLRERGAAGGWAIPDLR